jgi:hypothetical protein
VELKARILASLDCKSMGRLEGCVVLDEDVGYQLVDAFESDVAVSSELR